MKSQRPTQSFRAFAHDIQTIMAFGFFRFTDANPVVANIDCVIAIRRGDAANGDFAGVGVLHRIQHRFANNLQQMHLHLRIQRQGWQTAVEGQFGAGLIL